MKILYFLLIVSEFFLLNINCWWSKGHEIVARVAYDFLTQEKPQVIQKVNDRLTYLKKSNPDWTDGEGDYPFVECSTMADEIKRKGGDYQKSWHFINRPILDQGGSISDFNFTLDPHNITLIIPEIVSWLKVEEDYQNSYVYQAVMGHMNSGQTEDDARSIALRLLIHYLGDVHQPLHTSTLLDHQYPGPDGDVGGNKMSLKSKDGVRNLHAVWDSVIYQFDQNEYQLPFSEKTWKSLGNVSQSLMSKYPVAEDQSNAKQWAEEGFDIASTFAYKGVEKEGSLSNTYIQEGLKKAEKRLVQGGRRLANLLKNIYDSADEIIEIKQFLSQ